MANISNSDKMTDLEMVVEANGNTTAKETVKRVISVKKRRAAIPDVWRVLRKAKKTFDAQLEKGIDVKRKCIEIYMSAEVNDAQKFWGEYMKQAETLLDSRKFVKECDQLGYDAVNIAEHIIFLGSATKNRVLKNGVSNVLGHEIKLYADRLSTPDADIYLDDIIASLGREDKMAV